VAALDAYAALDDGFRRWGAIPDTELAKAHAVFRPHRVPAHTLLQRAGEPVLHVSFIVRGLTRIFYVGAGGTERTKGFRAEGELVCSYSAVLRDGPSQQYIEALEPCELLTARRVEFARLSAGHPAWADIIGAMTERLFLDEERRHQGLLTEDATTRYRAFVTERPALAARLTQRQIAAYIGVTPEAVSRIRAALASR
jgi:CRP-like cAMP-binding protein